MRTAGIPLVDLFDLTDRAVSALPSGVQEFIDQFAVVSHRATRSDGAIFHHGSLRALDDSIDEIPTDFNIGIGRLQLPLLQSGIPFQLAFTRTPGTSNLEPFSDIWRLDLVLDVFTLITEKLEPAIYVPEAGATPRHLLRDPSRDKVRITGSATLRIEQLSPTASVTVRFIDQSDPLDPQAQSGAVASIVVSPPHFFIGGSEFGLSIGKLLFDASDTFTPAEVVARTKGPGWQGVFIREATFYAPRNLPAIGDLSGGVKNILLGSPAGLEGELEIQFGRTALDPAAFNFEQVTSTGNQGLSINGSGQSRTVTLEATSTGEVAVLAGFTTPAPPTDGSLPTGALQDWSARWNWPGRPAEDADASSGSVRAGQTLKVSPIEVVTVDAEPETFEHPEVSFRFIAAGTAPTINATINGQSFTNVVHMSGIAASIATAQLTAVSTVTTDANKFEWQVDRRPERFSGLTFTPPVADITGGRFIILREKVSEDDIRTSRLLLQFREDGDLLVGCEAGVFNALDAGTALALAAVEYTVDLSDFHSEGTFEVGLLQSFLDPADATQVEVPADGLAQVTLDPGTPAVLLRDRHVQILMDFDTTNTNNWGEHKPATADSSTYSQSKLLAWANRYPGADFLVIGRCGDIGSTSYNTQLALDRAERGEELLTRLDPGVTGTVIDSSKIVRRGEQSVFSAQDSTGTGFEGNPDIALQDPEKSTAVGNATHENGWLVKAIESHEDWTDDLADGAESIRKTYRRIDIYAIGGSPTPETALVSDEPVVGADLRRSLIPATGRDPAAIPAGSPSIDYRVKLRIVWESPTVSEFKDAIPTLAEAEFAWTPQQAPLPDINGAPVALSREVLTVFVNWLHDARTGYTKATLGIKSEGDPDGLISTENKMLTAALAFGPVLLAGVDADNDVIGSAARVAALLTAVGLAEFNLGGDNTFIAPGSKTALLSAAFETEMRSISDPGPDMQIRVITDYVCTLHIDGGVFGIKTVDGSPMKIRYKNVGIEYDTSASGWERFGLVYDTTSLEIEDPGRWEIDGVLGQLLRISEVAMGRGSIWFEARIAIALEIGIVEITEAIIRLTFEQGNPIPTFELRGFTLRANIPGVLEGEGRLRIEDGGVIRAGVDANIIPLGLGAQAGLAIGKPPEIDPSVFLELFLGVQFATPLPLAQSGMAIYGFKGLFVMNGQRKLGSNPDPVGRELDWWRAPPGTKYEPSQGQYALGVGVVVGTMPDVSFCVSCSGMLVIGFPDPEVLFGVDVKIIEVPDTTASDEGGSSGTITGLIVIDDEAVKLAVSAQYDIPKVLKVHVPFSAYFPYPSTPGDVYVRIGSDGQTEYGRFGEPVTLILLPGTLDVRAWTYLMIEQGGLINLGGDPRFSFDGFSVGFGAGWEVNWSAGPIKLSASAKVLIGFGTAPLILKGGVFVAGELDLVVLSISARGELILEAREDLIRLDGEFCGEVDLFFFSISGCVGVTFGGQPDLIAPAPDSPVKGISLTDRRDRLMGKATTGTPAGVAVFSPADPDNGAAVDDNHTVWPDTAPIIHFSHYVENAMGAGAQFMPAATPSQPKWWGSNGLKYTYRLDNIELRRTRDGLLISGDNPLQSVWTATPYRQPNSSGDGPLPSEHEGPNLKLLDWNPWSWVVNLDDGGASQDGDPSDTVDEICDPPPAPRVACVFGRDARRAGLHKVRMRQQEPSPPPYPSRFYVTGEPALRISDNRVTGRAIQTLVQQAGGYLVAGAVTALAFPATLSGTALSRGYRIPSLRIARTTGLHNQALPWEGLFDRRVALPTVYLMVCSEEGEKPGDNDGVDDPDCESFTDLQPGPSVSKLEHNGIIIRSSDGNQDLKLADNVDQRGIPAIAGSDGSADILLPSSGVEIQLRKPCDRVELHVMLFAGPLKAEAFAATGQLLDADSTPNTQRTPHVIVLDGNGESGIGFIKIAGGSGEAVLFRICCRDRDRPGEPGSDPRCEDFKTLRPSSLRVREAKQGIFGFRVADDSTFMQVVDRVDQRTTPPQPGNDGNGDIHFPESGVIITLDKPCLVVDVHVMRFSDKPVEGTAQSKDGTNLSSATAKGKQGQANVMRFTGRSDLPVQVITLKGGGNESVIYCICCHDEVPNEFCVDFAGALRPGSAVAKFSHGGMTFSSRSGADDLVLKDAVNAVAEPDRPGQDRTPDLQFSSKGVRIGFKQPCNEVNIKVMLFAGENVEAVAMNGLGARISKDSSSKNQRVMQTLRLIGPDIRGIDVSGGAGEAVIYEICCVAGKPALVLPGNLGIGTSIFPDFPTDNLLHIAGLTGTQLPDVSGSVVAITQPLFDFDRRRASNPARLLVDGLIEDRVADRWRPRVVEQSGRCSLMAFSPVDASAGPWNGFRVTPPAGISISVVGVCGIDQKAVDNRTVDIEHQIEIRGSLIEASTADPDKRREIVLQPGEEYSIEIDWSYQAFQSENPEDPEPDPIDSGAWLFGGTDVQRFQIANDSTVDETPQDGLNEYRFDARDLGRYLIGVEPADGRGVQFTEDPIWVHFDNGHVEQLLEQYGRELNIEIQRTDPPPTSPRLSPDGELSPLFLNLQWQALPLQLQPIGYQQLNESILEAPCIPGSSPVGGASIAATGPLEPNADYDLEVHAPRTDGSDAAVVLATRFHTSRYANPTELMHALGYPSTHVGVYLPDDLIVADGMGFGSGAFEESDSALDKALAAVDADTLALPQRNARTYLFWQVTATGDWQVTGLLIDSLEPLKRIRTVVEAGASEPVVGVRCEPSHALVNGNQFNPYRANANWTRMLFTPATPITLPTASDLTLSLQLDTSDGTLTGSRRLRGMPSIIEREGL